MQELRIYRWCDVCHAEKGQTEATERYSVAIGLPDGRRMTPRLVETCEQHGKPFREMKELVAQVGILPKGEETKPTPVPKPRPEPAEEDEKPKKPRYPSQVAYDASTDTCPLCGVELKRSSLVGHLIGAIHDAKPITQPKKCPDCGERFEGAGAMGMHRRRAHGYDLVVELAKRARK